MTTRGTAIGAGIAILLLAVFFGGARLLREERGAVGVGMRAPEFTALTLDTPARRKTLADYRDDVILLNIWATWCGPCRVEMPSMQELHAAYDRRGLRIVAVSVDSAGTEDAIRDFVREYKLTFDILHDPAGAIQRTYRTTGVPETFVLDRDRRIRRRVAHAEDWSSPANRRLIEQLLAEGDG